MTPWHRMCPLLMSTFVRNVERDRCHLWNYVTTQWKHTEVFQDCQSKKMSTQNSRNIIFITSVIFVCFLVSPSQYWRRIYRYFIPFIKSKSIRLSKITFQTYHARNRSEYEQKLPTPTPVNCPKCDMSFRTRYLLAVHCVGVHTTAMTDFSLIQTSFDSWTQFEVMQVSAAPFRLHSIRAPFGFFFFGKYPFGSDCMIIAYFPPASVSLR